MFLLEQEITTGFPTVTFTTVSAVASSIRTKPLLLYTADKIDPKLKLQHPVGMSELGPNGHLGLLF